MSDVRAGHVIDHQAIQAWAGGLDTDVPLPTPAPPLMRLQWSSKALSDLVRLLVNNPRIGEKLEEFEPGEVRRILVGRYEIRYEILESTIYVLRLWHTREER